jgi:hypothetical protein
MILDFATTSLYELSLYSGLGAGTQNKQGRRVEKVDIATLYAFFSRVNDKLEGDSGWQPHGKLATTHKVGRFGGKAPDAPR